MGKLLDLRGHAMARSIPLGMPGEGRLRPQRAKVTLRWPAAPPLKLRHRAADAPNAAILDAMAARDPAIPPLDRAPPEADAAPRHEFGRPPIQVPDAPRWWRDRRLAPVWWIAAGIALGFLAAGALGDAPGWIDAFSPGKPSG